MKNRDQLLYRSLGDLLLRLQMRCHELLNLRGVIAVIILSYVGGGGGWPLMYHFIMIVDWNRGVVILLLHWWWRLRRLTVFWVWHLANDVIAAESKTTCCCCWIRSSQEVWIALRSLLRDLGLHLMCLKCVLKWFATNSGFKIIGKGWWNWLMNLFL